MNAFESEIVSVLAARPGLSQRGIAELCGFSTGKVNQSLRVLKSQRLVTDAMELTKAGRRLLTGPKRAVILAAGYGLRMIPINNDQPKGLLMVRGEVLVERLLRQLRQAGVEDIAIVVGFLKERFEYLIDEFGVELLVNRDYPTTGSSQSLRLAENRLRGGGYILPCDVWCEENPFREAENGSWYLMTQETDENGDLYVSRDLSMGLTARGEKARRALGIAWLSPADAPDFFAALSKGPATAFWEESGDCLSCFRARWNHGEAIELNTYEQLRALDPESGSLESDTLSAAAAALNAEPREITNILVSKKGMTNRSFNFICRGERYMMRVPGEGTEKLIDRAQEYEVYQTILPYGICDDVVFIDPKSGYKISRFIENARVCDPHSQADVAACMRCLRSFHELGLKVRHFFDLFGQIEFYESLWNGRPSVYRDYGETKRGVLALRSYIESCRPVYSLTHIDAVPDNFLFTTDGLRLIDWEYAGMQDPHVDIAMFIIYSLYDKSQADALIDAYFPEGCPAAVRAKIYCYIAACGLLWSNWCEYKYSLGVDFGDYSLRQYRYAKEYVRYFNQLEGKDPV